MFLDHERAGNLSSPGEGTHVLSLAVYPLRGIAVARTESNDYDVENNTSVAYVEQIPKGPFDGYLDLHFKGLGRFVGQFVGEENQLRTQAEGLRGAAAIFQTGVLEGSIEFHGGGYRRWSVSHAGFPETLAPSRLPAGGRQTRT